MSDQDIMLSFENPEHPVPEGEQPNADLTLVTPDYFNAMQIPMVEGRDFSNRDNVGSEPVMIVNRAFANKFFRGENVLGKKLKPGAADRKSGGPPWREVVGVVDDIRLTATDREMSPAMYLPASQLGNWCCLYTVIRSSINQQESGGKCSTNPLRDGTRTFPLPRYEPWTI